MSGKLHGLLPLKARNIWCLLGGLQMFESWVSSIATIDLVPYMQSKHPYPSQKLVLLGKIMIFIKLSVVSLDDLTCLFYALI